MSNYLQMQLASRGFTKVAGPRLHGSPICRAPPVLSPPPHDQPSVCPRNQKHVIRFWFQKLLKSVLQLSGIPAGKFSSHAFRIGATTSAAQDGLSKQHIQTLGRWSSEAFQS
ncbi:hypothetical protein H4Q32_021347 [Labeo rohita]|uniref:Proline and serine-rich 1-like protein n=1 Tax=Labeo rohita TaxID=84645 RepID=A0ABQ8MQM2_LABRO|nr:hypothetical protein H4Q32_021347 [Labeo rohita]